MIFQDWGLIDYNEALQKQLDLVAEVADGTYKEVLHSNSHQLSNVPSGHLHLPKENRITSNHPGYLIFCTHPAVVTTGRQTESTDIFGWDGPIVEISRGGKATYHGPSQVVVYPILNLKQPRKNRGPQEIRGYLRDFEKAIIATLQEYDVKAEGQQGDDTGVWIKQPTGTKKIASLGIAVKKWITFHGAAINVQYDPKAFQGINPCGFTTDTMTSLEQVLDKKVDLEDFKKTLKTQLEKYI